MSERMLRRISLEKLMDLKVDYAFKLIFGSDQNKGIIIDFLNALLKRTGTDKIDDLKLITPKIAGEFEGEELSRLDFQVVTLSNKWMQVQIHLSNHFDSIKRSIFYWSQLYTSQLTTGMTYKDLRPIILINLLNFDLLEETELVQTTYHLFDDIQKQKLTDMFELHFIEFPKLLRDWKSKKADPYTDISARWLLLLSIVDDRKKSIYEDIYKELELIAMKDDRLLEALRIWQELSLDDGIYQAYTSRLKSILEEESTLIDLTVREEEAFKKGVTEGRKKEKIELAKKMITNDHELEYIAFITGLTLFEVKTLNHKK